MLKYKEMLEEATKNGVANEKTMWLSVANVEVLLDEIKIIKPQLYLDFLRHQHELMYKGHYSEEFAEYDISKLKWEDAEGNKHEGAYWTKAQVLEARPLLASRTCAFVQ